MRLQFIPLILGSILVISGCSKEQDHKIVSGTVPPTVTGVIVEKVELREVAERQDAVGTVRSARTALLAARIAGTVTAMHVKVGDRVNKGQLLAVLEADETIAGAAAATAGVEEAKSAVDEAVARKKLADTTHQRYQKLFSEQAVTKQEYEIRLTEKDVAAQGVLRAESRLEQARQGARGASVISGYAKLVSPMNGVVTVRSADSGATVFPGTPIITLEAESDYRLEVQVPETIKGRIAPGEKIEVDIEGQQSKSGAIVEIAPVVDPASRTFTVKIAVSGKALRSGVYGRAFFPIGTAKGILIPKTALLERGTLTSVWVIDDKNIARMRLVKPGRGVGETIEILTGITAGERLVTVGIEKLTDGARVE